LDLWNTLRDFFADPYLGRLELTYVSESAVGLQSLEQEIRRQEKLLAQNLQLAKIIELFFSFVFHNFENSFKVVECLKKVRFLVLIFIETTELAQKNETYWRIISQIVFIQSKETFIGPDYTARETFIVF